MTTKKPLTLDEIKAAADEFFPLFEEISSRMPGASAEDKLKALQHVAKLASQTRADKEKEQRDARFGFLKLEETEQTAF